MKKLLSWIKRKLSSPAGSISSSCVNFLHWYSARWMGLSRKQVNKTNDSTKATDSQQDEESKKKDSGTSDEKQGKKLKWIFWLIIGASIFGVGQIFYFAFSEISVWLWIPMTVATVASMAYLFLRLYEWFLIKEIIITKVPSGYAQLVQKLGEYAFTLWSMPGFVELSDGMLVSKKHLYHKDAKHKDAKHKDAKHEDVKHEDVDIKKYRDTPLDDSQIFRGEEVCVKMARTRRLPKKEINIDAIPAQNFSPDSPQSQDKNVETSKSPELVSVTLSMEDVFLDKNFNFMQQYASEDLSLSKLYDNVFVKHCYPKNFFSRVERGFYYKTCSVKRKDKDEKIEIQGGKLTFDQVIVKTCESYYEPLTVRNIDHGSRRLYGGLYFLGMPWNSILTYNQVWTSLNADGKPETTDTKKQGKPLRLVLLKDDIYLVRIEGAEEAGFLQLDLFLLIKMRVTTPHLAILRSEKYLENITAIAGSIYRQLISEHTFESIIGEKTKLGQTWWKTLELELSDPEGIWVLKQYGVWVLSSDIWKVDIHGDEKFKAELQQIQAKVFKADQQKKARITEAEGEARAVELFFEKIQKFGSDGLQILFMQTLEKLGEKDGKVIIPFGNITQLLQGTLGGDKTKALAESFAENGITVEKIAQAMMTLNDNKRANHASGDPNNKMGLDSSDEGEK